MTSTGRTPRRRTRVPCRTSKEITGLAKPKLSSRYENPLASCAINFILRFKKNTRCHPLGAVNVRGDCCDRTTNIRRVNKSREIVSHKLQEGPTAVFFKALDFARNLARDYENSL